MRKYVYALQVVLLTAITFNLNAQWTASWAPYYRHCNSVVTYSNQRAIIAGGNEFNDSIRSVFTSNDRGANWGINLDILRPWLKGVAKLSNTSFVAVGGTGAIIKSTDNGGAWVEQVAPGNSANRNFNAVFFVDSNIGYIAGGWRSLDSIQTILKTTDGGANWSIQRDNLGRWLTSIYFTSANNGIAVGERGTILKTTDGGANWNPVTLAGNVATRNFNKVFFTSATTGYIVGGNRTNDSIQTILKTTDGGDNWSVQRDNLGPMFNSIEFATASKGYIVGNRGVVFETNDGGDTWTDMNFDLALTDTLDLLAADFYNADFGFIVGRFGKIIKFDNPLPSVATASTLPASNIGSTSAQLNGIANGAGSFAKVTFEYGTTPSLGNSVAADPDTVFGNTNQNVSKVLNALQANTFYYYRLIAENGGGSDEGDIKTFYTADCIVPNCDFEAWDTAYLNYPTGWVFVGNVDTTTSYNGSTAMHLTSSTYERAGAVLYGDVRNDNFRGGLGLNGVRPDSLVFYAKYSIMPNDTAMGVCIFTKAGQIYHIHMTRITGSSGNNFERISGPIVYPDGTMPDSVIVGVVSTNAFNDSVKIFGSEMIVDDIKLIGISDTLPNSNFENISHTLLDFPQDWRTRESEGPASGEDRVQKVTDRVSGQYAIKLLNIANNDRITDMNVYDGDSRFPAFPVGGKHLTFNFFTKYFPLGGDTLNLTVTMFKGDSVIGNAWFSVDSTIPQWTPIELPIYYHNNTLVPDSAQISVRLGGQYAFGASEGYFDNFSFDGFRNYNPSSVKDISKNIADALCKVYPVPAADVLNITYVGNNNNATTFLFTDITGKQVQRITQQGAIGTNTKQFDISSLSNGIYFVTFNTGAATVKRKFTVAK